MKAASYKKFGPANEVLEVGSVEDASPAPGEVLVRVEFSGVNPVDVKRREGGRGEMEEGAYVIPHFDGAGIIESVGEGVETSRVGERVWFYEAQWGTPFGSCAELTAVPAARAVPLPDGVASDKGAGLGIPALTAHRCVFGDGPVEGLTLLVTGGAGAVGRYAIQFAKLGGARVLTTVSDATKAEVASEAGCDVAINYRQEDVASRIQEITEQEGIDRIVEVELGGNLETSLAVLKTNGAIASYASQAVPEPPLPFYAFLYKSITLHHVLVFQVPEESKTHAVDDISRWMKEGKLSHNIGTRFPLDDVSAAHRAVEQGANGKVLIEIGS